MKIEVYTDGSATTKDKPGGYGWVIVVDGIFHSEGSGSLQNVTNNDMELEGAIMGLANAAKLTRPPIVVYGQYEPVEIAPQEVILVSDSQIVLGWLSGTYRFKQLAKRQKYLALMRLKEMMNVTGRWVEGHTGVEWNERADKLAGIERRKAMGIDPSKRVNRSKVNKEILKKLSDSLYFIRNELVYLEQNHGVKYHHILDNVEEAIGFFEEKSV